MRERDTPLVAGRRAARLPRGGSPQLRQLPAARGSSGKLAAAAARQGFVLAAVRAARAGRAGRDIINHKPAEEFINLPTVPLSHTSYKYLNHLARQMGDMTPPGIINSTGGESHMRGAAGGRGREPEAERCLY